MLEARAIEEVSLGDFVLSGGEPAAIALIDACVRLLPGCRRLRRDARRGELCRGSARIPALYRPAAVAGAGGAGGAGVGRSSADPRLAPGRGGAADPRAPSRFVGALLRGATAPAGARRSRGGAMNLLQQLEAGAGREARRQPAGAAVPARRHGAGQRQGRRRRARAHPGLRGRLHRAARTPASTRTSPCARSPTARASSASFRCIRRASPRSRWCAAAWCGAPSSITCAASPASRRASPSAPATARGPTPNAARASVQPATEPAPRDGRRGRRNQPIGVTAAMAPPRTLFDKIWDNHVIAPQGEGTYLIYIDLHLIHEVTTPQAFEGLKLAGRKVRRPDATMAVADHNIPTSDRSRRHRRARNRSCRSTRWSATSRSSASPISRSTASTRASSTSSGRSRA